MIATPTPVRLDSLPAGAAFRFARSGTLDHVGAPATGGRIHGDLGTHPGHTPVLPVLAAEAEAAAAVAESAHRTAYREAQAAGARLDQATARADAALLGASASDGAWLVYLAAVDARLDALQAQHATLIRLARLHRALVVAERTLAVAPTIESLSQVAG